MKLLISAYACSPYKGSEPGVGWGFVTELAKHHDLWVIVEEERFRADIERYIAEHPAFGERVRFHFVRMHRIDPVLDRFWPPYYYRHYRRWHRAALDIAKRLHAEVSFDVTHQLTMVGFREPGYLWQLGIPFVWGPVGGMGIFPWRFLSKVGAYGALYYVGYNLYNLAQMRFMWRPRRAAQIATTGLIAATSENQLGALRHWRCSSTVISEVGLPREPVSQFSRRLPGEPLRIVWSGLHIRRKALNLGLEALALLSSDQSWELSILGQGRCTTAWQSLAQRLSISDKCQFHGWLARDEALKVMSSAHVMLITSLRDLTSTVTIEGLAMGLPIVCLDHCGFSNVVDQTCGIKVAVTNPQEVVTALAGAISRLIEDEGYRQTLAEGALRRAHDFSWARKVEQLNLIYKQKLGITPHSNLPDSTNYAADRMSVS